MELYTPVVALVILAAGFAIVSMALSAILGPRRYNRAKLASYECGIEPTPQPIGGGRFPVKYYLTAMLFILFDIEIVFLYPWAVASRNPQGIDAAVTSGLVGGRGIVFAEVVVFLVLLGAGFIYAWRKGVFQWR